MKNYLLLLVLACPLMSLAQHDDIYFVPKKEKKVIVASSAKDNSFVGLGDTEQTVDYDVDEIYNTDESYEYADEDFRYSTRIVRFRSPHTLIGSSIYWDLTYNSGINDWMVYDDGYYLDIYPTYNGPVYYYPRMSNYWWGWNRWNHYDYCWDYNYWWHGHHHHYTSYQWNMHHHHYGSYIPSHIAHNSWFPKHKIEKNIPLNGSGKVNGRRNVSTNGARNDRGTVRTERGDKRTVNRPAGQSVNRVPSSASGERVNSVNRDNGAVRQAVSPRQPSQRVTNGGNAKQNGSNVRTRQPNLPSSGTVTNRKPNSKGTNVRVPTNAKRSSTSTSEKNDRNISRSTGKSSSGSSDRSSSTTVSRQRAYSSGSSSASGNVKSGSSRAGSNSGSRGGSRR